MKDIPQARRVSVIIPCRNEVRRLPFVLDALQRQTIRALEIIVADGMSDDGSREYLIRRQRDIPNLMVVDNAELIVPSALNAALAHCQGSYVARMDTHADYPPEYLEVLTNFLDRHREVGGVGSPMHTAGRGAWGLAIAATLSRRHGLGGARHRISGAAGPITHAFSACYRREALLEVGGWDARFLANEDFEADVRVAASGRPIWLVSEAATTWYVRESPRALGLQMWRYGFYKALTVRLHPKSIKTRQLVPPVLATAALVALINRDRASRAGLLAYLCLSGIAGGLSARRDGASTWRGVVVPWIVHLSWGAGALAGAARFAFVRDAQPMSGVLQTSRSVSSTPK